MKFANIWYLSKNVANIGEGIISLSLEHIYRKMGIPEDEIVWVNHEDVATYDGEECIFPIISFLQNIESVGNYSNRLRPVFICYVTFAPFTGKEAVILKKYEPIGCRDAYTLLQCEKNGIKAYFNGCITATLPRSERPRNGQIVLSDVEPELLAFIPNELKEDAVTVRHNDTVSSLSEYRKRAREVLELFAESPLCITSRLHCASPSIAFGTPVVFAKNRLSSRFSWIDRFYKIYAQQDYQSIDWSPKTIEYEQTKNTISELIKSRISEVFNGNSENTKTESLIRQVDSFYRERPDTVYPAAFDKIIETIAMHRGQTEQFNYAFWGYSPFHGPINEFLTGNYPNAKLTRIYEDFRTDYEFGGLKASPITVSSRFPEELIICFCSSQASINKMRGVLETQGRNPRNYIADFYQE